MKFTSWWRWSVVAVMRLFIPPLLQIWECGEMAVAWPHLDAQEVITVYRRLGMVAI